MGTEPQKTRPDPNNTSAVSDSDDVDRQVTIWRGFFENSGRGVGAV